MIMDRIRTHNNDYLTEAMSLIQADTARNPVLKYPFEWESFLEPVLPKGTCVNVWHVNVNKKGKTVLLIKERSGQWSWPGGKEENEDRVELTEHANDSRNTAAREGMEETSIRTHPRRLVWIGQEVSAGGDVCHGHPPPPQRTLRNKTPQMSTRRPSNGWAWQGSAKWLSLRGS